MAIQLNYPVTGPITQKFGVNPAIYAQWGFPGHNGVDFGIPNGTAVLAAASGTIDKVSFEDGGYGNYVKIKHADGSTVYYTYYAHLLQASVSAGQAVVSGAVIGLSNSTGASTGPHLHFGLRSSNTSGSYKGYMDPLPYLTGQSGSGGTSGGTSGMGTIPAGSVDGSVALPDIKFEVLSEVLNVRNGPGIGYTAVGKLARGTVITSRRLFSDGAWVEIEPGKWCAVTFAGVQNMRVK